MTFRENLWSEDLSQVELRTPLTVPPETPVRNAIETMRQAASGCILICDGVQLRGIFTERDLVKRVLVPRADLSAPVSQYMTPDPLTVRLSDSVGLAIRTMVEGGYRRLPVTDEVGTPIGIVSVKRIARYLADCFPSAVYNLPPQPRQVLEAREGA